MKAKGLLAFLLLMVCYSIGHSQRAGIAYNFLDGNQVKAMFANSADLAWNTYGSSQYEVPKGSGLHSSFASSLWVGGLDQTGTLRLSAQTYRQGGVDFFSGAYRQGFPQQNGSFAHFYNPNAVWSTATSTHGHVVIFLESSPCGVYLHKAGQNTLTPLILPVDYNVLSVAPLADGRILFFGQLSSSSGYPAGQSVIVDVNGSTNPVLGPLLNFQHFSSRSAILSNGKTLLVGPYGSEVFDPINMTSVPINQDTVLGSGASVIKHSSGSIFRLGGRWTTSPSFYWASGVVCTTEIHKLDMQTNSWVHVASLPAQRNRCHVTEMPDGRIMVLGGHAWDKSILAFDVNSYTFDTIGTLPAPFDVAVGTKMSDGRIFVYGENTGVAEVSPIIFDPTTLQLKELKLWIRTPVYAMGNQVNVSSGNEMITYHPSQGFIVGEPYQKVWKINKADIQDFLLARGTPAVGQERFKDILSWPAHGVTSLGEDANLAPFVDVNGNGHYDPLIDGDYPCIQGDQMLWWVFHDQGQHSETRGNPMGIQVEASAYVFDCNQTPCPDTTLNYTVFLHYEITNKSNHYFHNTKIGLWQDGELGYLMDDYVGSDLALDMGFFYNSDDFDEGSAGYGLHPPALGTTVLTAQGLDGFQFYNNDFSLIGNPETALQYYQYLNGLWKDGEPVFPVDPFGYSPGSSLPPTMFHFSGDPGFCGGNASGWYEKSTPSDRRGLSTIHMGSFVPGQVENVEYAIIWTRDMQGDNLASVCQLKNAVPAVKQFWNAIPAPCLSRLVSAEEREEEGFHLGIFPNPAREYVVFESSRPLLSGSYQLIDQQGRTVLSGNFPNGAKSARIDLPSIPSGMYFLQVADAKGVVSEKLVILD